MEFFESIKRGDVKPIYFFVGSEAYIKRKAVEFVKNSLNISQSNIKYFYGDETDVENILRICTTKDMFSARGREIIVVKNGEVLRDGIKELVERGNWHKDRILILILNMGIQEFRKKKFTKKVSSLGTVVDFPFPAREDFEKWLKKELKVRNIKTDRQTFQYLASNLPPSLEWISRELDKLQLFSMGELDIYHVEESLVKEEDVLVYRWVDFIIEGKKKELVKELENFMRMKRDTHEVYYYLAKTFRYLYMAGISRELLKESLDDTRRRKIIEKLSKRVKKEEALNMIEKLMDALIQLRSGGSPGLLIHKTLLELMK